MMSCDPILVEFSWESSRPPSLDPFPPWLYFSKLSTEFYDTPSIEDSRFILPSCLDGSHQGYSLYRETTHNEYLCMQKIILMWHGLDMVIHMMPTLAHAFIDYEKDHSLEPSNGLYFT
jgi:hypothetical protein